jgi:hypothetical protein
VGWGAGDGIGIGGIIPPSNPSLYIGVMDGSMRKSLCVLLGIGFLASCVGREPQVDKVIEDGVEVVLNHLEPYKIKG